MSVLRSPISPIFDARVVICVSFVIAKRSERALTRKIVGYNGEAFSRGCRGVAQPGSAPALGAGGRWFKSNRPDQSLKIPFEAARCAGRTQSQQSERG